jgi:hypothetical protein
VVFASNLGQLGQPTSTARRWAKEGMPVERKGRRVEAWPDKLNLWLGHETREPVQIATETPASDVVFALAHKRFTKSMLKTECL